MTDQPQYFDDVDKLKAQLEYVQTLHAQSLQELQQNEGKLLDKRTYNAKRKMLTEAHESASQTLIQTIEDTKEATRKRLALDLRYSGESETERRAWTEAVRMVEGANTVQQQEELVHRALRWGDKELARALIYKFGGRPEYKAMHEVLAGVDSRVKAAWDYERKHGIYKKQHHATGDQAWAGWQTYRDGDVIDIPGRPAHLQPSYLREQKRKLWAERNSGNK